jgi:hypothetical protein
MSAARLEFEDHNASKTLASFALVRLPILFSELQRATAQRAAENGSGSRSRHRSGWCAVLSEVQFRLNSHQAGREDEGERARRKLQLVALETIFLQQTDL